MRRQTQDLLDIVRVGCGVLAGFAAFGSTGYLMMKMQVLAIGWVAGTYRPADFTVEWAVLDDEAGFYAVGTVDGKRERLPLHEIVARPARQEELDKALPGGQSLRVGYSLSASATTFNGASLRIVPWQDGLPRILRERALTTLVWAYGPLMLLAAASVSASVASRKSWAPPLGLAAFFLMAQLVMAVIVFGSEMSTSAR